MPQANCFDAPTLKDYLLGKLSDEQSDVVAAHLEACLACEATVSQLDRASDTLTNGLRLPAVAAEPQTDDELQKALDKVQSLEALANHPTSEVSASRSPVLRDYRLLEPLGSGGMGTVYKAVHTRLDRLVAVKLLPARRLGDEQAVARFQREMRVIGQLSHPAIVQATDAGEVDGTHFLVMEFVEGFDLNTIAKACGPLSVADACEIARQAALGLEYAHQQGIVHRDIKPSNLMLSVVSGPLSVANGSSSNGPRTTDNGPTLKILDLGLALLSGEQAPVDELTTVGQLMGTLDYMAPEQLEDSHWVGPRADIYALAATLYRLLTGAVPFAKEDRKTPLQKLRALATQSAPPIRERRADLPEDLAAIIDRALNRDPAERFTSMSEFAEQLAPWCVGHDLATLARKASAVPPSSLSLRERVGVREPIEFDPRLQMDANGREPQAENASRGSARVPHPAFGHPLPKGEGTRSRHWFRWFALLAFVGFVALGVVIVIETNTGTLIVESVRDGVEVRVKKSGRMVEPLEVTTGSKTTRLAAGEYEIEVAADGLQIQNNKFVLKRGDTVVAKVTEIPKGQIAADKPGLAAEPTTESLPRKPVEVVDRNAKGMETFEASNLDLAGAKKIREALQKQIDVAFEDLPLTDCLTYLQDQAGIEFFLDKEALTEDGIPTDAPCHLKLNDVRLAIALEFLLRPLQCAWVIDQGQVLVTTKAKEGEHLVTRSYPVGRLLPGVRQAVERMKSEAPTLPPGFGRPAGGGGFGGGFFQVGDTDTAPSSPREALWIHRQFGGAASTSKTDQQNPNLATFVPTEGSHFKSLLAESLDYLWVDTSGEGGNCELLRNVLVVRHTWRAHADIEALLRVIEAAFLKPLTEPVEIRPAGYSLEADAKLREQLAHTLEVSFTDTPLTDVAEWLGDKFGVPVLLETDKLSETGIATDTLVTLQFKSIPGDVLLSRLLDPLQLDFRIEHGLLLITTKSSNKERLVTKVYDVRDLFARGLHPNRLVSGLATTTSGPWQATDGEGGTLVVFADTLLVIRHTSKIHDEVAKSIASLRTQLSDQPESPFAIEPPAKPRDTDTSTTGTTPAPNPGGKTSTTPAKLAPDNQPRYDGKTFDEWLAVLDVERSPTRLADAIEALRLLGRDMHAEQIAERVLHASRVVDFDQGSGNKRPLLGAVGQLFVSLPDGVTQRAFAKELRSGTTRSRLFLLGSMPIEKLVTDDYALAMLSVCRDNDSKVRELAVSRLIRLPLENQFARFATERTKQLRAALSDAEPQVAYLAAAELLDSEPDSTAVAKALIRAVEKPKYGQQKLEALNRLAIMGLRASSVASQIAALLQRNEEIKDEDHNVADMWLERFRHGEIQSRQLIAAVALARMGQTAKAELPKIDEVRRVSFGGYEDRKGVSLDEHVQWPDLLLIVRNRIEPQQAFDLRGGDLNLIESALRLVAWNHNLLQMEQALLEKHQGKNHPSVKTLADEIATMSRAFTIVNQLRGIRRTVLNESPRKVTPNEISGALADSLDRKVLGSDPTTNLSNGLTILADSPRVTAIQELGKLGTAARGALPVLKKELESKDEAVVEAAKKAIQQIEAAKADMKTD